MQVGLRHEAQRSRAGPAPVGLAALGANLRPAAGLPPLVGANSFAMGCPAARNLVPAVGLSRLKPLPQNWSRPGTDAGWVEARSPTQQSRPRTGGPRCARRQPTACSRATAPCRSEFIRDGMSGRAKPCAGRGSFAAEAAPTTWSRPGADAGWVEARSPTQCVGWMALHPSTIAARRNTAGGGEKRPPPYANLALAPGPTSHRWASPCSRQPRSRWA
ncbi:hypothetical protein PHLH8_29840 [Pseudomonas sp. Pc102]|nr:hypothetical protein PHLH8_29840 [Pseudomonas sp. Pc102]